LRTLFDDPRDCPARHQRRRYRCDPHERRDVPINLRAHVAALLLPVALLTTACGASDVAPAAGTGSPSAAGATVPATPIPSHNPAVTAIAIDPMYTLDSSAGAVRVTGYSPSPGLDVVLTLDDAPIYIGGSDDLLEPATLEDSLISDGWISLSEGPGRYALFVDSQAIAVWEYR
jgi:hypothetical protein